MITRRAALLAPSLLLLGDVKIGAAIFDSRLPQSRAFAAEMRGWRLIDVAEEERRLWRTVRNGVSGEIVGLTRWSDLRGALQAQGRRVHREIRLPEGALFLWAMR